MEIANISSNLLSSITTIAIGGFDGVHFAHQELIRRTRGGAIVVIENQFANLTPSINRLDYIPNPVIFFKLDEIRSLSGEAFIAGLKSFMPQLTKIVIGYDFHFGKDRANGTAELAKLFDGEVEIVEEIKLEEISVHSKTIREYIKQGNIGFANTLLAHPYAIKGDKIAGQGLGKTEFVPTINIAVKGFLLPNEGVFISKTTLSGVEYESVTFIGHRVSTDGSFAVESYLFGYAGDEDEHHVRVELLDKLRANQQFENFSLLKAQIDEDLRLAKKWFTKDGK